jgi:hypothetical protein
MVESSTYLFADDTKIFREIREEKDEKMLQADCQFSHPCQEFWSTHP